MAAPQNSGTPFWSMKLVPVDRIARDPAIQIRGGIDPDLVAQYKTIIEDQGFMDPVALFRDGEILLLADGFHRLEAYLHLSTAKIPARIKDGSRTDALKYALRENGHHGAPLTNAQKRYAAQVAVLDPGIAILPDKDIAVLIGCSVTLVNEVRRGVTKSNSKSSSKNKPKSGPVQKDPTHQKMLATPGPAPSNPGTKPETQNPHPVYLMWPEVPRFYVDCLSENQRLQQRIRRAFEKANQETEEMQPLADLLFEKIRPCILGMLPPQALE